MKRNNIKIYAKALSELVLDKKTGGPEQAKMAKSFFRLLEKNGLMGKAKEIIMLAEDYVLQKKGNKKIVFESARKILPSQKKLFESCAKEGDIVKENINLKLIAGVKIIINGEKQIDYSLNKKLQEIFK
jgi:F0F1-type ATP synthase delta subunit